MAAVEEGGFQEKATADSAGERPASSPSEYREVRFRRPSMQSHDSLGSTAHLTASELIRMLTAEHARELTELRALRTENANLRHQLQERLPAGASMSSLQSASQDCRSERTFGMEAHSSYASIESVSSPAGPSITGKLTKNTLKQVARGNNKKLLSMGNGSTMEMGDAPWRLRLQRFVASPLFEGIIGIVIFLNGAAIGLETEYTIDGDAPQWLEVAEHLFTIIYIVELGLRVWSTGWSSFRDGWILYDAFLVIVAVTYLWIMLPIVEAHSGSLDVAGGGDGMKRQVIALRALKFMRFLRTLRMFQQFHVLWRLVHGLSTSGSTMLSTLSLVGMALYVFACIGVELITKDGSLRNEIAEETLSRFDNLFATILTLFQFVTLDNMSTVYYPIVRAKPVMAFFFLPLILTVSIALMNLVTAMLVERALDQAQRDENLRKSELKRKVRYLVPRIKEIFDKIDLDGSGKITLEEVAAFQPEDLPPLLRDTVSAESLLELFEMLDIDGSGDVDQDEFVEGVLNLATAEGPKDLFLMLKLLKLQRDKADDLEEMFRSFDARLQGAVDALSSRFAAHARTVVAASTAPTSPGKDCQVPLSEHSVQVDFDDFLADVSPRRRKGEAVAIYTVV